MPDGPTPLMTHAAWVLVAAFVISLAYEIWRATAKSGTSRHDSMRVFVREGLFIYVLAGAIVALLLAGFTWSAWAGLVFSLIAILVSVFYYNPKVMTERKPGIIDWVEDLVFTGLLFVAAALLLYEVTGWSLIS